jgi:hypothetical protein
MNQAQTMLVNLISTNSFSPSEIQQLCQDLPTSNDQDMLLFVNQLCQLSSVGETDQEGWELILASCEAWARQRAAAHPGVPLIESTAELMGRLYSQVGPHQGARYHLLSALAAVGQPPELDILCGLMKNDPPQGLAAATAPFFLLLQPHVAVDRLFPELFECLDNQDVAIAVLEIANHLTRDQRVPVHPGTPRIEQLLGLLGGVTQQLELLQNQAMERSVEDSEERRKTVSNGISLAVALCDSLGLVGDQRAVRPLKHLMDIKHRRVRVEAAAAIARLGHIEGKNVLRDLVAEPSVRLRVLAYAEELDFLDLIDEKYSDPASVAEAELVTYLSQPTNMGVPPSACELVDMKTLYWPGFEEPRNCYLFRYTYHAAEPDGTLSTFRNLGIAGPLIHAFHVSIDTLVPNDAYAMFAGWQAEHEDILQFEIEHVDPSSLHPILVEHRDRIEDQDYSAVQPHIHGKFFGDDILVARCEREGEIGTVVVDPQQEYWYAGQAPPQGYCIYKGHRLLQAFNGDFDV